MTGFFRTGASFALMLLALLLTAGLSACGNNSGDAEITDAAAFLRSDEALGLPRDTAGEITVMMWSGAGIYRTDVGRVHIPEEELTGSSDAMIVATARAFNQIYPNIQINFYGREGGGWQDGIPFEQYREQFTIETGILPDVFAVADLPREIEMGTIADLTIFEDDPMLQVFNQAILDMIRLEGRLWGMPFYLIPWGVFVNKSLAETQNLDMPSPQWTLSEYMRFTSNSRLDTFYGAMSVPYGFLETTTMDIHWQLANRGSDDPFVRLNTTAIRDQLEMMVRGLPHAVWAAAAMGNVSDEFMAENDWWGFEFFRRGNLLVHPDEPWYLGASANPDPEYWAHIFVPDWDIYPRPSTDEIGNHIGIVFDSMAIRNFAIDDGDPNLNEEEYNQLAIAWEFLKFFSGDTRAWEARATQRYNDGGTLGYAASDSFPFVIGTAFDEQMQLWFTENRARFADPNLMPGFHYVLELLQEGAFPSFSDKNHPWFYDFEGERRSIMHEWINKWDPQYAGAADLEPNWTSELFARLPDWDREINQRFADGLASMRSAIARFYPEQVRGGR